MVNGIVDQASDQGRSEGRVQGRRWQVHVAAAFPLARYYRPVFG
jgi:hypothetical protein